jgi:hypothetical protein
LETLTTFTDKNGNVVKGCNKYESLTQKRLEILDRKLKKLYPGIYQDVIEKLNKKDEKAV